MRNWIMAAGLAIAVTAVPVASQAACSKRTTGTVVGAVGGGLLGHTIAGRGNHTEGALLGAAVGGLAGNQLTKCKRTAPRAAYRTPTRSSYRTASNQAPACRYETRAYYDHLGRLMYAPQRVCGN